MPFVRRWSFPKPGPGGQWLACAAHGLLVGDHEHGLFAVDARTGELRWQVPLARRTLGIVALDDGFGVVLQGETEARFCHVRPDGAAGTPWGMGFTVIRGFVHRYDGAVLLGGARGSDHAGALRLVDPVSRGVVREVIWPATYNVLRGDLVVGVNPQIGGLHQLDLSSGTAIARTEVRAYGAHTDGDVILLEGARADEGKIVALDRATGARLWDAPAPFQEWATFLDGTVVHAEEAGEGALRLVARASRSGEVRWETEGVETDTLGALTFDGRLVGWAEGASLWEMDLGTGAILDRADLDLYGCKPVPTSAGLVVAGRDYSCYTLEMSAS